MQKISLGDPKGFQRDEKQWNSRLHTLRSPVKSPCEAYE